MPQLNEMREIILECQLLPGQHRFIFPAEATIGQLLAEVLNMLANSEAATQAHEMLAYYQPELLLQQAAESVPLNSDLTLDEAGLLSGSVCRIGANPRKDKQLFCRWC